MILPKFPFPGRIPIVVSIENGIAEGGGPIVALTFTGKCHFDEISKTRRGGDNIDVTLSGLAIIDGDIAPTIETIVGSVTINAGKSYKIFKGKRIRDIGGIVHHTELELI